MVGLIQKVLFDLVHEIGGVEAVAEVKRRACVAPDRRYRLDTVYPDEEWQRLLRAACEVLNLPQDEVEIAYADLFARDALARWPVWFEMSANARQFLERQQTIHNAFATGVRDAEARRGIEDKFRIEKLEHEIVTHYRSPNQLCGLYKALARWILEHYREQAVVEEPRCVKRGDAECASVSREVGRRSGHRLDDRSEPRGAPWWKRASAQRGRREGEPFRRAPSSM